MSDSCEQAAERAALAYLAEQLGERAPGALRLAGAFDERPLEGEGRAVVFAFELPGGDAACGASPRPHYVVAGQTEPNYFPAYEMTADEAYSFHIGTRFMLVMGISKIDTQLEPPGAREALRRFVASYARGATVQEESLAGLFRCEEAVFAVYRLVLDGEPVYCLGGDCPPGFYRRCAEPPQMVLRLHLGQAIRAEARAAYNPPDDATQA